MARVGIEIIQQAGDHQFGSGPMGFSRFNNRRCRTTRSESLHYRLSLYPGMSAAKDIVNIWPKDKIIWECSEEMMGKRSLQAQNFLTVSPS